MRNDRIRLPEESAKAASTLVDLAEEQSEFVDKLLDQLKMTLEEFDRRTTELTRDMPDKIAQQAAQKVVQSIADLVAQKVADVVQPAGAKAQTLLRAMENAAAEYRRAAWYAVAKCIIVACISGSFSAALVVVFAMKMAGVV